MKLFKKIVAGLLSLMLLASFPLMSLAASSRTIVLGQNNRINVASSVSATGGSAFTRSTQNASLTVSATFRSANPYTGNNVQVSQNQTGGSLDATVRFTPTNGRVGVSVVASHFANSHGESWSTSTSITRLP